MMRILALTWTTEDHDLPMINVRGDLWCPAIDGLAHQFMLRGHQVIYLNLLPMMYTLTESQLKCRAFVSGLPYRLWDEIKDREFDLIWHAIKDPTPPQAIPHVEAIMRQLNPKTPVLNHINHLRDHNKRKYLAVLNGLGAKPLNGYTTWLGDNGMISEAKCYPPSQAAYVSLDRKAIRCPLTNSQRFGHLFKEDGGITLYYRDNEDELKDGFRTIVRLPYASGRTMRGFRYYVPKEIMCPKTGSATEIEEYELNDGMAVKVGLAMQKMGVDLAMVEGLNFGDKFEIFDVNPFPMCEGKTLTPLAARIAERIEQVYDI